MKYKVTVDDQIFEVEIKELTARPVIVLVDGEEFEVWPENGQGNPPGAKGTSAAPAPLTAVTNKAGNGSSAPLPAGKIDSESAQASRILNVVRAPIPGVITAVNVQPGSHVKAGQQLCLLEAMKMNNSIRSSRQGQIKAVLVATGQHVKHNEILVEFSD